MSNQIKIHYIEVVTEDVDLVCASYSKMLNTEFSDTVAELGGAHTAPLADGGIIGVRAPMHDAEEPVTRPYYLVSDIDEAVTDAEAAGAQIAVPPMEIPGRGKCAIIMFGPLQSGFWQL